MSATGLLYFAEELAKPSRLVTGWDFRSDGTYAVISSGPSDALLEEEGVWSLVEPDKVVLEDKTGQRLTYRIAHLSERRLVLEED